MPTKSFTTRIDSDLMEELDKIARFDDRSTSYIANQAIKALVEERQATREVLDPGLELIKKSAPTIPAKAMHDWLLAKEEQPFPEDQSHS